jgi:GTP-binding protein HflX
LELVKTELYERFVPIAVHLPYQQGALISLFHESGQVERVEHVRGGMVMEGRIPGRLAAQFAPWISANGRVDSPEEEES